VPNSDGSISTVRTISIGVDGGEVVIPTVLRGKIVSDDEAIAHYERTGANFGTFRNPEEAKAFSEWLHNKHAAELAPRQGASATFAPRGVNQAGITSTYRTPAHNREVGGVPNSYHTRRGANGEPLAVDSVPPPGESMSAYAARLRRENPGLEVINEGDHVHIEPRGR
jgi:hypothetical protein